MTTTLSPYVSFPGTAKAALDFYASIFGGSPQFNTFGQYGVEGADPEGIMHGMLTTDDGLVISGADGMNRGGKPVDGDTWAISISGDESEKLHRWFDALAEGGRVEMPIARQMWGDEFGIVLDKFGVKWMVDIFEPRAE